MTIYNYTTAALIEAELRATIPFDTSTSPTLADVTEWITEESAEINQLGGQFYGETVYAETLDYDGSESLILRNAPLVSVSSIYYSPYALGSDNYDLNELKVVDVDYTVYNDTGVIPLLGWSPTVGRKRILVNYSAGFETTPLTVQKLATKKVALRVIDTLLEKDVNEKKSGKSVSVGSISIVKPADFGVSQYNQLNTNITQLEDSLINGSTAYRLSTHRL